MDPNIMHSSGRLSQHEVDRALHGTAAYRQLDQATQLELRDSLAKVLGFIAANPAEVMSSPVATELEPLLDLQRRLSPQSQQPTAPQQAPQVQQPEPVPSQQGAATGAATGSGSGQGAVSRAGDAARAALNAIDFPQFCSALIQGVFQSIVESHIQQMEAYAKLLKSVAQTVDQFMVDNISPDTARDYLADQYDGFIERDISKGQPRLKINDKAASVGELPSFFKDLGLESPQDLDDATKEEKVVPAARLEMARQRQQTLATMVLLGINRVMVSDGEISAKLQFHIDASETMKMKFDQNKTTFGSLAGRGGLSPAARTLMVNTASLNAQSDLNLRADLTGQVKVNFKTDAFPLDKFADSAAIQLINQNARVPAPAAAPPQTAAPAYPAAAPASLPAPSAPLAAARPAAPPTKAAAPGGDPWAPR